MPKTPKTPDKAAPALPSIDAIESVAPDTLPESTRGTMSDDEKALAAAVIAATDNGNAARGPEIADRKDAASAAARIKRLIGSYWRHAGVTDAERATVKTSVVPKGSGYAWVIKITAHATDESAEIEPESAE